MDGLLAWDKPQGGRIVGFSESGDPNDIHWLGEQPTGTIWVTPSAGGHRPTADCGHCWAESNGQPDRPGDWEVIICEECDMLWPCDAPTPSGE